jgi:hypothetical protein
MEAVILILGVIVLFLGRTLFWLGIATAGFLVGVEYAQMMLAAHSQWVVLAVAVAAGAIGAILAVVAERVAFALAGGYAGVYLGLLAMPAIGITSHIGVWCLVSGIVAALVAFIIMDWAIIGLSSLVGAGAIVGVLHLRQTTGAIMFTVLVVVGVLVQARRLRGTVATG